MAVPISSSKQTLCECVVFVYLCLCLCSVLRHTMIPSMQIQLYPGLFNRYDPFSQSSFYCQQFHTHTGTSVLLRNRQIDIRQLEISWEGFKILFKRISEPRPQCGYCAGVNRDTNLIPLLVPRACKKYGIGGHPTHYYKILSEMEVALHNTHDYAVHTVCTVQQCFLFVLLKLLHTA